MATAGSTPCSTSAERRTSGARAGARARAAAALLLVLLAGCGRNADRPFLIPTGVRPLPAEGPITLTGRVAFDPLSTPDMASPPYPPTVVELWNDSARVAVTSLSDSSRDFRFEHLYAGRYTVYASARLFVRSSVPPHRALDGVLDVGDVVVPIDPLRVAVAINLLADFNGFPPDFPDSTRLDQNALGVWTYPNADNPAQWIPAGTYRVRFATDFAVDTTDYGSGTGLTYEVPLSAAPIRTIGATGADLRIHIATPGRYQFTLDERRQSVSIQPLAAPAAIASRRPSR